MRHPRPATPGRAPGGRVARCAVAVASLLVLAGCVPETSDGGQVVVTPDQRIAEVRAARSALAEPVPQLLAAADAVGAAAAEVWGAQRTVEGRAALVAGFDVGVLTAAADALAAVDVAGEGPDVEAVRELVDTMVADATTLATAATGELADLPQLPPFDAELEALPTVWNARGSYSAQLQAFEDAATAARALAARASAQLPATPCLGVWERRAAAAELFAERTDELRGLIRDRRGVEFDDQRKQWTPDPFGNGGGFAADDAAAGATCFTTASAVPGLVAGLHARVDELTAALDPADLRGG